MHERVIGLISEVVFENHVGDLVFRHLFLLSQLYFEQLGQACQAARPGFKLVVASLDAPSCTPRIRVQIVV